MPSVKPVELKKSLSGKNLFPVYLLYGEDARAMEAALAAVEGAALEDGAPEFNADYFHGKEAQASQIIAAANTLPVMAGRRLVSIRRADEIKSKEREKLIEYCADPCSTTVLVMSAPGLSLRGAGARKEDRDLAKACEKSGLAVEFPRLKPAEIPRAIEREMKARGKTIDRDAVNAMVELAGSETLGLFQEIEKIALYVGDQDRVKRDDVLSAVADVREAGIFEFTDAIGARDVDKALRSLLKMRERGEEPLMILGMLLRHFRILWKVGVMIESGDTPGSVAKKIKLNEWILKNNYLPQTRKFPPSHAGQVTTLLAGLDMKMKNSRAERDVLFEKAILDLCLGR